MDLKQTLTCIAASALLSVGACSAAWFLWLKPPQLVTFDMKDTTNTLIRQAAKLDLTEDQRHALLSRFDRSVTAATDEYAREHDTAILVSPAVITGLPDATPEIQVRLADLMKAGSQP